MKMAVVLPIPHIQLGKVTGYRGNEPKDSFFIFYGVSIQRLLFKTEPKQLSLIQSHRVNILRRIPKLLHTIVDKCHMLFGISLYNGSFTHQTFIVNHYYIAGLELTKFYHTRRFYY